MGRDSLKEILRHPGRHLETYFRAPSRPVVLVTQLVAPLVAVRPLAVLLRSLIGGTPVAGVVLALGSLVLGFGAWLSVALLVPVVARQFKVEVSHSQAFALVAFISVPLWLAGALYVVPDEPAFVHAGSRLLVLAVALYGLVILWEGLGVLGAARQTRLPLSAAVAVSYLGLYAVLSTLVGVSAHILIYLFGDLA